MEHDEIHAAILASLPEPQRSTLKQGYAYVECYLQQHHMTWDDAYDIVEDILFNGPPIAANDEPKPFEIELLEQRFQDRNIALVMYYLFPLSNAAHQMLNAILMNQIEDLSSSSRRGNVSDPDGGRGVQDLITIQNARSLYCSVLQSLNIAQYVANDCTRKMHQALRVLINKNDPARGIV